MPNRMLRESFLTSESVAQLDWFEQAALTRLFLCCDDFGRMDARLLVLRARLFPLSEGVTPEMIGRALDKLEALDTLRRYQVGGLPYLQFTKWFVHQKPRFRNAKYPPDPGEAPDVEPAEAPACARDVQHSSGSRDQAEVEDQDKAKVEAEAEVEARLRAPDFAPAAAPAAQPVPPSGASACGSGSGFAGGRSPLLDIDLPNGGRPFRLLPDQAEQFSRDFPELDIPAQLRKMADWLRRHPQRQKKRAELLMFVRDWLERCRCPRAPDAQPPPDNPANRFAQRKYDAAFFDSFFEGDSTRDADDSGGG